MNSEILDLNLKDLIKGVIMAALAAILTTLYQLIFSVGFTLSQNDLLVILKAAVLAMLAYLSKQLITDESGKVLGKI